MFEDIAHDPSIGSTSTSTSPAAASAPPPAELADADENDHLLTLPRPEYNVTIKSDRKTPSTAAQIQIQIQMPEPHAPSALLELSSLDPGLGARAQDERRAASIARGSRRTRSKKRSGCITRQYWSSRLSRPDVCVKGPYL